MEGVPEAGLLALLGRERLDRLEVEVVVQVEVAQALAVDEKVEHIVPLAADLQPHLHPVQLRLFFGSRFVCVSCVSCLFRVSFFRSSCSSEAGRGV